MKRIALSLLFALGATQTVAADKVDGLSAGLIGGVTGLAGASIAFAITSSALGDRFETNANDYKEANGNIDWNEYYRARNNAQTKKDSICLSSALATMIATNIIIFKTARNASNNQINIPQFVTGSLAVVNAAGVTAAVAGIFSLAAFGACIAYLIHEITQKRSGPTPKLIRKVTPNKNYNTMESL